MSKKRFRTGNGIFKGDYFSEAIIDEKTGERYYDGIKPNYVSSKEVCELLNNYENNLNNKYFNIENRISKMEEKLQEIEYYFKKYQKDIN